MNADPKHPRPTKPLLIPGGVNWSGFQAPPKKCESCKVDIWFWLNPKTGKRVPVNRDCTSHFTTCTTPARFSKRKSISDRWILDIHGCARCGAKLHEGVEFQKLRRPAKEFEWWAPCPVTGEPVLMLVHNREGSAREPS